MTSVYDFSAKTIEGEKKALADYKGKVLLIVNVASQCGFTPQYAGLEALQKRFGKDGFSVLGFPCNQFGAQEPGSETEIARFCETRFGVTFPLFAKIDVNGEGAHPLYRYLTSEKAGVLGTEAIKWNFTKFLIDREGRPVARYGSSTKPEALEGAIKGLL
jgi:glutathione peroxidase